MSREIFQPILLSIIVPIWAFDEARDGGFAGPQWLHATVCALIALNIVIRIWRGRAAI